MRALALLVFLGARGNAVLAQQAGGSLGLRLDRPSSAPVIATIRESALDGHEHPRDIQATIEVNGRAQVALRPGAWMLEARAAGYWSPRVAVGIGQSAELTLYEQAVVSGSLAPSAPTDIGLRLERLPGQEKPPTSDIFACEVGDRRFTCRAPKGTWGFSLRSKGHAASYFVSSPFVAPVTMAEPLVLEPGASLAGWVSSEETGWVPSKVSVRLIKRTPQEGQLRHLTKVLPAGFFQIKGLDAGDYQALAIHDGLAPDSRLVRVIKDSEAFLVDPLILTKATSLDLTVKPPLGPDGKPWQAEILEVTEGAAGAYPAVVAPVVEGHLLWPGLRKNHRYSVWLKTSSGQRWSADEGTFTADKPVTKREIVAGIENVSGHVKLAGRPLRATLSFGASSNLGVILASDDDGLIHGALPRLGPWRVRVESSDRLVVRALDVVAVRSAEGFGTVEIDLGDHRLRGVLVDENDRVFEGRATVTVTLPKSEPFQKHVTGGRFELAGLQPGNFQMHADADGLLGETVSGVVKEAGGEGDDGDEVRIVMKRKRALTLKALGPGDAPLPGLAVAILPSDVNASQGITFRQTDADGKVSFSVSASESSRCVFVYSERRGLASKLVRLPVTPEDAVLRFDSVGGTIDFGGAGNFPGDRWLVRDGCRLPPVIIRRFGGSTFPAVEPGSYSVCAPEGGRCSTGLLKPLGTVVLQLATP